MGPIDTSFAELEALARRTREANEARSPEEWIARARSGLESLRVTLRNAKAQANESAGVQKDEPVAPAAAIITGAAIHIATIAHAIDWLERTLSATASASKGVTDE